MVKDTFGTDEAAKKLGVSRSTLLRWFGEKRIKDVRRDHRNWRIFTEAEISRIEKEVKSNGFAKD